MTHTHASRREYQYQYHKYIGTDVMLLTEALSTPKVQFTIDSWLAVIFTQILITDSFQQSHVCLQTDPLLSNDIITPSPLERSMSLHHGLTYLRVNSLASLT